MKELKMLFSPIRIGTMELRNRIVQAPMYVQMSEADGSITEREVAYHAARAKGGFSLIRPGVVSVHPLGYDLPGCPALSDDKYIPGWEKLAKAVHAYGAKLAPQLQHTGNKAIPELIGAQPLGPSPSSYPISPGIPLAQADTPIAREVTEEEIEEIIEAYGEAARRARDAGCDAVEVHGGHGYQLAQFMSPAENRRTDSYGGGIEGRLKFPLGVIRRIRNKIGNFPIIFRISGNEMMPGGRGIEETQLIAWLLEDAGVDCIDVSRGSIAHSMQWIVAPGGTPPATWVTQDTWLIKQVVNVPVVAVGRITDPHMAEFILETGKADLIGLGRASLADPELPNKAAAGNFDAIRHCIGCGCTYREGHVRCTQNPELGEEAEMQPLVSAERPRKVLVAGGGPGGLEAARVAALRGHDVTLCEKSDRLGGQFWIGSLPPGKQELTRAIKWLSIQAKEAGAKIQLGKEVTRDLVEELNPDVVIVATGGAPLIPTDILGIEKSKVATAHDVLTERVRCGPNVVVLGGNMVGCEVAEWLGFHRKNVTVIEMQDEIALDVDLFSRAFLIERLAQFGVKIVTGARVKEITDNCVVVVRNGQEETISGGDSIVLALGTRPANELAEQIKGKMIEVHTIGDAKEPRKALDAIEEGARVARKI